jgi:putative DNA primase/helicase
MTQTGMDDILYLASLGFRVHPLIVKNKIPIIAAWERKASTDPAMIRQWAIIHKGCNWGLATGIETGVFVVDLDAKAGGLRTWKKLLKEQSVPTTAEVITGGGGIHLYFQYPKNTEIRNSAGKIGKGIDIRGEGGQVVIPPSIHPNGVAYRWKTSPKITPIAKAPKWLINLIIGAQATVEPAIIGGPVEKGTRNNQIYHQALYLARQGALQDVTLTTMLIWCKSIREEIDRKEIEATVASAYKYHEKEKNKIAAITDIELSDVGNAQRLIAASGTKTLYVPSLGWHIWDEKRWEYDVENLIVTKLAIDAMEEMKVDIGEQLKSVTDRHKAAVLYKMYNWAIGSHSAGKITAMVNVSKAFPQIVKDLSRLDDSNTDFLINCANGTLDMRTGKLSPHDSKQFITRLVHHNYNPKAKCPTWLETLNLAFGGNKEMISFFQRAVGYSASAALSEQCFFICWGERGNNGKSTLIEALQRILGQDYAVMTDARVISSKDKDNHVLSSLAALNKVRIVSINEIAENAILDEELIKQLTGGDTLQAKKLYMEPFTYRPVFKIWVRANNKPTVRGTGEAFWRRVKLIPFTHQIPEARRKPRHEIDALLLNEAEGILAWIVKGFRLWYEEGGLQDPPEVQAAWIQYKDASDIVAQFLGECIEMSEKGPKTTIARQVLYGVFREWCKDQGLKYVMSAEKLARRISERTGQYERVREKQVSVWVGMKLTANAAMNYSF